MSERKAKSSKPQPAARPSVDEASADSFPASDPPSWSSGPSGSTAAPPAPRPAPPTVEPPRLPGLPPPVAPHDSASHAPPAIAGGVRQRDKGPSARSRGWVDPAALARLQGAYFLATGAWPLLHLRSFEWATGGKRKSERWLVKTVGVLAACIGTALLASTRGENGRPERGVRVLGATTALGFLAIDVWYVGKRAIAPIYLVDAVIEGAAALGWMAAKS